MVEIVGRHAREVLEENNNFNCPKTLRYSSTMPAEAEQPSPLDPFETPKHVVVVMDALKEFSMEPLEWVLKNVAIGSPCIVTLLGVMPWLNIPLSAKTWSDIWSIDLEDLSLIKEWKSDPKYQKVRTLLDLCQHYGVVLDIRKEMGHPLYLLVIEQISSLHATLVVFDRYHERKHIDYYAEKVPCNMVRMKEDGEVDMIKGKSCIDSIESSPVDMTPSFEEFVPPTPKLIISEQLKKLFSQRSTGKKQSHHHYHQNSYDGRKTENADFSFGMCMP